MGRDAGFSTTRRAWLLITVAGTAVLAVGAWGLAADRSAAATIGTVVDYDGGRLEVQAAWTLGDPMAGMHTSNADQFAQSGMAMSQMIPDAVPEGMKRVAVEVSLAAGDEIMLFPADGVTLTVGDERYSPYKALLGGGNLAPGTMLSCVVTFEVPQATTAAEFRLAADAPPVLVDVSDMSHDMNP